MTSLNAAKMIANLSIGAYRPNETQDQRPRERGRGWLSLEYCNHESGKETSRLGVGRSVWLGARFATPPMTVDSFRRTTQDC